MALSKPETPIVQPGTACARKKRNKPRHVRDLPTDSVATLGSPPLGRKRRDAPTRQHRMDAAFALVCRPPSDSNDGHLTERGIRYAQAHRGPHRLPRYACQVRVLRVLIDGIARYDPSRVASLRDRVGHEAPGRGHHPDSAWSDPGLADGRLHLGSCGVGMACGAGLWWLLCGHCPALSSSLRY